MSSVLTCLANVHDAFVMYHIYEEASAVNSRGAGRRGSVMY